MFFTTWKKYTRLTIYGLLGVFAFDTMSDCKGQPAYQTVGDLSALHAKVELYRRLSGFTGDTFGYIHSKCDGVGFTALCKIGGGCSHAEIFWSESTSEPGRWFRHPSKDCFPDESRSDDSNDHAIMRMLYFYAVGDRASARRFKDYIDAHGGELGRNDGSADGMSATKFAYPVLLAALAGRKDNRLGFGPTGYQAHLMDLYMILDAALAGKIDPTSLYFARQQIAVGPHNALAQAIVHKYTDGDQSAAIAVLMDEKLFPADRLPTSAERCEEYLWQRNENSGDWEPCPAEGKIHSGTDLLFAAWLIEPKNG